jgi:hypothetical protein
MRQGLSAPNTRNTAISSNGFSAKHNRMPMVYLRQGLFLTGTIREEDRYTVTIYTAHGTLIYSIENFNGCIAYDLSFLPSGIYFMRIPSRGASAGAIIRIVK